ncbi:MAG TPA: NfeD family protein [Verrucomicrobiae bacterium]
MTTVIILLLAGAALLALETLLPGLIAGIVGFICIVAGVAVAYVELDVHTGNRVLVITIAGLIAGFFVYLKYFPESRVAKRMISDRTIGNVDAEQTALLHQTGTALTNLRPSGTALINGQRVDVVTEGGMIEQGAAVKVIAIEGMRTVVRAI